MPTPSESERLKIVNGKLDAAVLAIQRAGIPGISDKAVRTMQRKELGEIDFVTATPDKQHLPSLTGFFLDTDPADGGKPKLVILVNPVAVMSASRHAIETDLVRTFAVVDTYPEGYEKRLRPIYEDAVIDQEIWLEEADVQPYELIPFDPRKGNRNGIIRRLMGDAAFYCDTGFDDWQKAAGDLKKAFPFYHRQLDDLKGDKDLFIATREAFADLAFKEIQEVYREDVKTKKDFIDMSSDVRAYDSAAYYVNLALALKVQADADKN